MTIRTLTSRESDFAGRPRAVIVTGSGFQDHDNIYCGYRLREAGFDVDFATADGAPVIGKYGTRVPLDKHSKPCSSYYGEVGLFMKTVIALAEERATVSRVSA